MNAEGQKRQPGDIVALKTRPETRFVVMGYWLTPHNDHTYRVRRKEHPEDSKGFLLWDHDLVPIQPVRA